MDTGKKSDRSINLTFGSGLPPDNPRELVNIEWIKKIQNETGNMVRITPLYRKNVFEIKENRDGTAPFTWRGWQSLFNRADIAVTSAVIPGSPFPISLALKYFVYGINMPGVRYVFEKLWEEFPELRAEYSGCKRIAAHPEPEFWVLSKKPVYTLGDFKGLKLSGLMGEFTDLINRLEATAVNLYDPSRLASGEIDALIFIKEVLLIYNTVGTISYATNLHTCNPPLDTYVMNPDIWHSLPPDIREIFDNSKTWLESELDKVILEVDRNSSESAAARGLKSIELSRTDLNRVFGYMEEVAYKKGAELDSKGVPGTRIFKETRRLIEACNTVAGC